MIMRIYLNMENWNAGMLENWKTGMLENWKNGKMEFIAFRFIRPKLLSCNSPNLILLLLLQRYFGQLVFRSISP